MEELQVSARARTVAVLAAAAVAAGAASCGNDPTHKVAKYALEGSLTQLMTLEYDQVRVIVAPDDYTVVFVRLRPIDALDLGDGGVAQSEDYPFQLTVQRWGQPLPNHQRINLWETQVDGGVQRGSYSRNVLNDPNKTFPKARVLTDEVTGVVTGTSTLYLDKTPVPGGTVNGDFNVTFENGIEPASGRTVFSTGFWARVVQ